MPPALRAFPLAVAALVVLAVAASTAHAGPLVASAEDCDRFELELPFLRWLDPMSYVGHPGGSFESEPVGWSLGNASIVEGNERFYVRAATDDRSLSIPPGTAVTTSTMCVGINEPTLRLFTSGSGSSLAWLRVEVLFENSEGKVQSMQIGGIPPGPWNPTRPMPILANLLPLLPDGKTPVRFRFTPVGTATWRIDDVYVDPRKR